MAQVRYLDDAGHLRTAELPRGRFVVGRIGSCQITFEDEMVSREHAQIDPDEDGRFRIRDLGSRNKTYVNGQLITETVLAPGDIIRIGEHILEFLDEPAATGKISLDFLTPDRNDPPGSEWIKTKTPVTLSLDQVGRLAGLSSSYGVVVRPEDVADAGLSHLLVDLQAERGFVALRGEGKKDLRIIAHRGLARAAGESLMPVSQTFVYSSLLQQVAGRYPTSAAQIDPQAGFAASGMVAPLLFHGETVGVIYVDRPTGKKAFTTMALQQFTAAGAQLGALIGNTSRRIAQTAAREGVAALATVRRLHDLLSPPPPSLPDFEVAWKLLPGQSRCGDTGDLVGVGAASACALIVDAGGHGVVGLAQAAAIRTALRAALTVPEAATELGPIFTALNRAFAALPGRQFIACCAAHIDITAGRLSYVNAAGRTPLLIPGPTRMQSLDQPSLILGADPDYVYESAVVDLPPQFRIFLHTDGLIDACNAGGEAFGDNRLKNVLLDRKAFGPPDQVVDLVVGAFSEHLAGNPRDDDALIMVIGH